MNSITYCIGAFLGLLIIAGPVPAQQATEIYIPIGQSPGLSSEATVIGTIASLNESTGRITIAANGRSIVVTIGERTLYYLDSSHVKRRNYPGNIEHCEIGRRIEAHIDDSGYVEWIKIAVP